MRNHKVYLVGAGPGDPGLITVRGREILRQADVVIYDYLVDKRLLEETRRGAELICCDTLGKVRYSDGFIRHNELVDRLIIKKVKEGKKVIRLKNGDPCIFSRLSQELDALVKKGLEFEIVPGVTAASAAASSSGIPLTDRRFASACVFVTGHEDNAKDKSAIDPSASLGIDGEHGRTIDPSASLGIDGEHGRTIEWPSIAKSGTMVLYMAMDNLGTIVERLIDAGRGKDTPVAIVQDAALLTQEVVTGTLRDVVEKTKARKIRPPAIVIVGEVVKLRRRFDWLTKARRILFTGLSSERFFTEGRFFHLPMISIVPADDYTQFDAYLKNITDYDWIVYTSRYGVRFFFSRLKVLGYDSRIIKGIKVAAIGNSTKLELEGHGISADIVPKVESSRGLVEEFEKIDIKDRDIFMPRSDLSDKGLVKALEDLGAKVTSCIAYKNIAAEGLPDLDLNKFDEVIFTSPSGVRSFVKRYGRLPKAVKVSYIGDVTYREAKRWHLAD